MPIFIPLNLYTFELPENQNCHYVLTSPRSLQACRQLNLRPVDLLPKSESDIAEQRPDLDQRQRFLVLQRFESNRIKYLEAARNLRQSFIEGNIVQRIRTEDRHNSPLVDISEDSRDEESCKSSPELEEDAKENIPESSFAQKNSLDKRTKDEQNQTLQIFQETINDDKEEKEKHEHENMENEFDKKTNSKDQPPIDIPHHEDSIPILATQKKKKVGNTSSYRLRPSSGFKQQETTSISSTKKPMIQNKSPYLCSQNIMYKPVNPLKSTASKFSGRKIIKKDMEHMEEIVSEKEKKIFQPNYHWISAIPRKSKTTEVRGSFLLRPSSANRNRNQCIQKPVVARKDDKTAALITLHSKNNQERSQTPCFKKKCTSRPCSSISIPVTKSSSESEPSPRVSTIAATRSEDCVRGRPKYRTGPANRRSRSNSRKRKSKKKRRDVRRHSNVIGNRISNLSRSTDMLNKVSFSISGSSVSLPAQMSPRLVSATSCSSLSSIASSNSSFCSVSGKRKHLSSRYRPPLPRSPNILPSRPTSSLAIPSYRRKGVYMEEIPRKKVAISRRSQSAKVSRTENESYSPRSVSFSLRRSLSTVSLADSQILAKFLSGINNNIKVTEHDKKILELLALKHEKRHHEEIQAYQSQQKWKIERDQEIRAHSRRWQEWQKQINDKRHRENDENERRWKTLEEMFNQSQENLSTILQDKEKKSQNLLQSQLELRLRRLEEKKIKEMTKKEMVSAAIQLREEKQELQRQHLLQLWDKQQKRIEKTRRERREMQKMKMSEVSSAERDRHAMRQRQVEAEGEALLEAMRLYIEKRMKKSEQNLMLVQHAKEESLRRSKEERMRKAFTVRAMHNKLETDLLLWRQHILQRQLDSGRVAEMRLSQQLKNKSNCIQEKLQQRQDHHKILYKQIKEKEQMEEEVARNLLAVKDWRSKQVIKDKESQVYQAKNAAVVTASLREQLRKTFSPDTFDRKVARANVEHRMENLHQAHQLHSRRSHIILG